MHIIRQISKRIYKKDNNDTKQDSYNLLDNDKFTTDAQFNYIYDNIVDKVDISTKSTEDIIQLLSANELPNWYIEQKIISINIANLGSINWRITKKTSNMLVQKIREDVSVI